MTYLREKVLANFKPSRSERIKVRGQKSAKKRAARPGNSEGHLEALRKCPCVVTLKVPAGTVHHLKQGTGERGAGMRSSDRWGIPLAAGPHTLDVDCVERAGARNEIKWFQERGIADPIGLTAALWAASPDVPAMTKIILANRGNRK